MAKKVGTVLMDKVDIDLVKEFLTTFNLSTDGSDVELVKRLVEHQEKTPKAHLADCSECKGFSDNRLRCCPFCGEGDEDVDVATAVAENPNATIETEVAPRSRKKRSGESTALAVVDPASIQSARELDDNVARIEELKRDAVLSYWELGMAIYENYEKRLFTLRSKEDGSPKYKSFNQFVVSEINMSTGHAYKLMDIAVNFTKADVQTYGVKKLALIAQIPKKDRADILERVKSQNATVSQVAEEVRKLVGGKRREESDATSGRGGLHGGAAVGARGTAASAANKPDVTVGLVLGKRTIKMYRADAPDRPALTIQHDPVCEEQMLNGVVSHYRLIKTETGLSLVITRKREKEGPAPSSAAPAKKKRGRPSKK